MSSTPNLPGFELLDGGSLLCVGSAQEAEACYIYLPKWLDIFTWQRRLPLGAGVLVGCKPDARRLILWASTIHSCVNITYSRCAWKRILEEVNQDKRNGESGFCISTTHP